MAGNKSGRGGRGGSTTMAAQQTQPQTDADIIAQAIGAQGTPATADEAIARVNTNYTSNAWEWTHNCQRCIWAAELQRRGYDVVALPRTSDNTYAMADKSLPNSYLNVAKGGLDLDTVGSWWYKSSATDFKAHFTNKYDVGARGILSANSTTSGHVFNWEIKMGKDGTKKVHFYDTQPDGGTVGGWKHHNVGVQSMQSRWSLFREARVDDKELTPLIKDFVKPR